MAANSIDLQFNVDTAPAERSLDKLSSEVPRSIEKLIKRFESLGKNIQKIEKLADTAQNKVVKAQSAFVNALDASIKKLDESISKVNKEAKNLTSSDFYKKLPQELKKSQTMIVSYRRELLKLQKEAVKAISGKSQDFDTKAIEQAINKIGLLKNTLERTVGISLKGIDASKFKKELKSSIAEIAAAIDSQDGNLIQEKLNSFFSSQFDTAEKALDRASNLHSAKVKKSISTIKTDIQALNKAIKEINSKNADLIALGAKGLDLSSLQSQKSGSVPNVAVVKQEVADMKKLLDEKIKLQTDINRQTTLLNKSLESINQTGTFSKRGMSDDTFKKAEAARTKHLEDQKRRIIEETREIEDAKLKTLEEAEKRVAKYNSKEYARPKRIADFAKLDEKTAADSLERLDRHIHDMEEREKKLAQRTAEIFEQIQKTGKYDKRLARSFNEATKERFEAAKKRYDQEKEAASQVEENIERQKAALAEEKRLEAEKRKMHALRIRANEQIRTKGTFDSEGMDKKLISQMRERKNKYLKAEKKRIFDETKVVYEVRKERALDLSSKLRQMTDNIPNVPTLPSKTRVNAETISNLNDSFDKYEDTIEARTKVLRKKIALAYRQIREKGRFDQKLISGIEGSEYAARLESYKKLKQANLAEQKERELNAKLQEEANRKEADNLKEAKRLADLRASAHDQIKKTWSFDKKGMGKELVSELNQFRDSYISQQKRAIKKDIDTLYETKTSLTKNAVDRLKKFTLNLPAPPILPNTDDIALNSKRNMIDSFDDYEEALSAKTKALAARQKIALEQIQTRAEGTYDKKILSGMEGSEAQRVVEEAAAVRQAQIAAGKKMEADKRAQASQLEALERAERKREKEAFDLDMKTADYELKSQWNQIQREISQEEKFSDWWKAQRKKHQEEQDRLFREEEKSMEASLKRKWGILQDEIKNEQKANDALNEQRQKALNLIKLNKEREMQALSQIEKRGKYQKKLVTSMDEDGDQFKRIEQARLKKMKEIRGQLYKKFNEETAKFPELKISDQDRDKFIRQEADRIVSSNAYRDATTNAMRGTLFEDIVDKEVSKNLAEVNKIRDLQEGFTRKSYKDSAAEIIRYAERLERIGSQEAKDTAKLWRKKAETVLKGGHDELKAYQSVGKDLQKEYLKHLDDRRKYYEQVKKDAIAHTEGQIIRSRKHRRRIALAEKRMAEIDEKRQRAEAGGAGYLTGAGGAGAGGRGGGMFGGDGFHSGNVSRYREEMDKLRRTFDQTTRAASYLRVALYTLGAGLGLKSLRDYFDAWTQFSNRIRLVTDGVTELKNVQEELLEVAERTAIPLYQAGELYEKLSRAGDRFNIASGVKVQLTELIGQTISISGSTAAGAKGAITQFIQGLGTELRGQELASVREQIPRLATAIAEGLDVPIAKLKELGAQGKITPDVILTALIDMVPIIQSEFAAVQFSIAQSFERISNAMSALVGRMFDVMNKDGGLSQIFRNISDYITELSESAFFPEMMQKLEALLDTLKAIGITIASIFSVKLIVGFGSAIGALFTALMAQLAAIRRETSKSDKIKTALFGAYTGTQGEYYTREQRRDAVTKSRETGAGGPALMAARTGAGLGMGLLFGGVIAVAAAFTAIVDKSKGLTSLFEALGDILSSTLQTIADAIDAFLEWAPFTDSAQEKIEKDIKRKQAEGQIELEAIRLRQKIENPELNIGPYQGMVGSSTNAEVLIQNKKIQAEGKKGEVALAELATTEISQEFVNVIGGIESKIIEDYENISSGVMGIGGRNPTTRETLEKNQKLAEVSLLREYYQSFLDAQQGIIDANKIIAQENNNLEQIIKQEERANERAERAKSDLDAGLINEDQFAVMRYGKEEARQAKSRQGEANKKLKKAEEDRVKFTKNAEEASAKFNSVVAEILPEAAFQASTLTSSGGRYKKAPSQDYKDFLELFGGGEGSFTDELNGAFKTLADRSSELKNIELATSNLEAIEGEKERYEGKDSILMKQLETIRQEKKLFDIETENTINDMGSAFEETLPAYTAMIPQITKSFTQAEAEANAQAKVAREKARREYKQYIDKNKNIAEKEEETLAFNKAYADKQNEIERERREALEKARQAREKSLEILKAEVDMEKTLLGLSQETLELQKSRIGIFNVGDLAGSPQEIAQEMNTQRQAQVQMSKEISDYLVKNSAMTQEEGKTLFQNMIETSWKDALLYIRSQIGMFNLENKEIAENLDRIMTKSLSQQVVAQSGMLNQIDQQILNLKNQGIELERELANYRYTIGEFGNAMRNLDLLGGADPVSQISNKFVSDSIQLASQRKKLQEEQKRIKREIVNKAILGEDTAVAGRALDRVTGQLDLNQQQLDNAAARASIDMESALATMRAKNEIQRQKNALRYQTITQTQLKLNLEILENETEMSRMQEVREQGARLSNEQTKELIELEREMFESSFRQRSIESSLEIGLRLQEQLAGSVASEKEALAYAKSRNMSQQELNEISKDYIDAREQIAMASSIELENVLKLIEAEKKLAEEKRKAARDSQIRSSGLFNMESLGTEAEKDYAKQLLDETHYGDYRGAADRNVEFERGEDARRFNMSGALFNARGDSTRTSFLNEMQRNAEATFEREKSIADLLAQQNIDLADELQKTIDQSASRSLQLENSVFRSDSLLTAYIEAETEKILEAQRLNEAAQIKSKATELSITNFRSEQYKDLVRQVENENAGARAEAQRNAKEFAKDVLRQEYKGFSTSDFDIFSMGLDELQAYSPFLSAMGMQDYLGIEKEIGTKKGGNQQQNLMAAVDAQRRTLMQAQNAARDGDFKEAEAKLKLAAGFDLVIDRLKKTSDAFDEYNKRQADSLRSNLKIERTEAFQRLEASERELAVQMESAKLRREGVGGKRIEEIALKRRKENVRLELESQQALLDMRHEMSMVDLGNEYDPASDDYKNREKLAKARLYQEKQLLGVQSQAKIVSLETAEELKKINEEQEKILQRAEGALQKILQVYFEFIGNIFGSIWDALFGDPDDLESFDKVKAPKASDLMTKEAEIEKGVNEILLGENNTALDSLREKAEELTIATKELIDEFKYSKAQKFSKTPFSNYIGLAGNSLNPLPEEPEEAKVHSYPRPLNLPSNNPNLYTPAKRTVPKPRTGSSIYSPTDPDLVSLSALSRNLTAGDPIASKKQKTAPVPVEIFPSATSKKAIEKVVEKATPLYSSSAAAKGIQHDEKAFQLAKRKRTMSQREAAQENALSQREASEEAAFKFYEAEMFRTSMRAGMMAMDAAVGAGQTFAQPTAADSSGYILRALAEYETPRKTGGGARGGTNFFGRGPNFLGGSHRMPSGPASSRGSLMGAPNLFYGSPFNFASPSISIPAGTRSGFVPSGVKTSGLKYPLQSDHLRYEKSDSGLDETPASAEMKEKAVSAVERVYKAAGEAFSDNDTQMAAITFGMREGSNDAWSAAGQGVVDGLAHYIEKNKEQIVSEAVDPSLFTPQDSSVNTSPTKVTHVGGLTVEELAKTKELSEKISKIDQEINLAYHSIDIAKEAIKRFDEVRSATHGSVPSSMMAEEEYLYEKIGILENSVGYSLNQLNQIVEKYIQPHLDDPTEEGLARASTSAESERERLSRLEEQSNEIVLLIEDFLDKMRSSVRKSTQPLVFELSSQHGAGGCLPKRKKRRLLGGGYLVGPSHDDGGIDLGVINGVRHEAEGGEYIIRKEAVNQLGVRTLDHLNETGTIPVNKRFEDGGGMHPSVYTTMSVAESNRMIRNELQDTVVNAYAEVLALVEKMKKEIEESKREEYMRVRPLGLEFSRHRAGTGSSSGRTVEEMMSGNNSSNSPFSERFWKRGEAIGQAIQDGVYQFGEKVKELHTGGKKVVQGAKLRGAMLSNDAKDFFGGQVGGTYLGGYEETYDNRGRGKKAIDFIEKITGSIGKSFKAATRAVFKGNWDDKTEEEKQEFRDDVTRLGGQYGRGGKMITGLAVSGGDPAKMAAAVGDFILSNKKVQKVMEKFGKIMEKILDPLAEVFLPVFEAVGELFVELSEILVSLMPLFELLAQALSRVAKIAGAVMKPIGSIVDTVMNFGTSLVNSFSGIFSGGGTKSKDDRISESIRSSIRDINKQYFDQFKRKNPFTDIVTAFDALYDEADRLNSGSKRRGMKDEIDRARAEMLLAEVNKDLIKSIRSLESALSQFGEDIGLRLHQVYEMFSGSGQLSFVDAINVTGNRSDIAKGMISGSGVYADGRIKDSFKREMGLSGNALTSGLTEDQALSLLVGGYEKIGNVTHRFAAQESKQDGQYVMKYQAGTASGQNELKSLLSTALSQELSLRTYDARSGSDSSSYTITSFLKTGNAKDAVTDIMGQYFGDTDIGKLMLNNALGVLDDVAGSKVGSYHHYSDGNTYSYGMDGSRDGGKVTGQYINEMVDQFLTIPDLFREAVESIGGTLERGQAAFDYIAADFSASVRFALKSVEDAIHDFRDEDGNINYEYDPIKASKNIADISNMLSVEAYNISQSQDFSEAFRQNPRGQLGNQRDQIANELVDKLMGAEDDTGKRSGGLRDQLSKLDPVKDAKAYLAVAKKIQIANEEAITKTLQLEIQKAESIRTQTENLQDELNLRDISEQQASQRLQFEKELYDQGLGKFTDTQMSTEVDKYTKNLQGLTDAFGERIYTDDQILKMGKEYEEMLESQNEEYDKLMSLFDRKQLIELERTNRQVQESFEDMEQAAAGTLQPLRGAISFLRYDLPDSLKGLTTLGDKDSIIQSTNRQIANAINDAGVTTAAALPALEEFGSDIKAIAEELDISEASAEKLIGTVEGLTTQQKAQTEAIEINTELEILRAKATLSGSSALIDLIDFEQRLLDIRNSQAENAPELIDLERQLLAQRRTEELRDVVRAGYEFSSSIQSIQDTYQDRIEGNAATMAIFEEMGIGTLSDDQLATYNYAKTLDEELPKAMAREIALENKKILDDINEQGINYSELGGVNRSFIGNLETIGAAHMMDFSLSSLSESITDAELFEELKDGRDLTKEQNDQINAAIAARRREIELINKANREESINKMADFFGVEDDSYTYSEFIDAMESLEETLKSLNETMEDLYYSDFNPTPFVNKLENAEEKYGQLYAAAMTMNEDGSYNAEAISEFQSYVQTYLGYQRDIYKSSGAYVAAYEKVQKDLQDVSNTAAIYGTKNANDRLIEGMEKLRLELIALGDHGGFAGEVQGLINQMEEGLPDGLEQAYQQMKASSIQMNTDVRSITTSMVQTMRTSVSQINTNFSGLVGSDGTLTKHIQSFTKKIGGSSTDPNTIPGAFQSLTTRIQTMLDSIQVPEVTTAQQDATGSVNIQTQTQNSGNQDATVTTTGGGSHAPSGLPDSNSIFGILKDSEDIKGQYEIDGSKYDVDQRVVGNFHQDAGGRVYNSGQEFFQTAQEKVEAPLTDWFKNNNQYFAIDKSDSNSLLAAWNIISAEDFAGDAGTLGFLKNSLDDSSMKPIRDALAAIGSIVEAPVSNESNASGVDDSLMQLNAVNNRFGIGGYRTWNLNNEEEAAAAAKMASLSFSESEAYLPDSLNKSKFGYSAWNYSDKNRTYFGLVYVDSEETIRKRVSAILANQNINGLGNLKSTHPDIIEEILSSGSGSTSRDNMGSGRNSFANGGYLSGRSHAQGGIHIEAEGGEYIMRKSAVDKMGVPFMNYLNEEGGLPFMRFGMGEFMKQDAEVGTAEVNSSDGELKSLIRELIYAIKEGDKDITDAIEEMDLHPEINVFTDLRGEVEAQLIAYDEKIREKSKRGIDPRRNR